MNRPLMTVLIWLTVFWCSLAIVLVMHISAGNAQKLRLLDENIRLQNLILDRPFCSIERDA